MLNFTIVMETFVQLREDRIRCIFVFELLFLFG